MRSLGFARDDKNMETRACKQCSQKFTVRPEDATFYGRAGVPAPTFCPDCRLQRRLAYRTERHLYSRACDLCKKPILAVYPQDSAFTVYCNPCWYSDKWDPLAFGADFDFEKPFFPQFASLASRVPRMARVGKNHQNSDYTNQADDLKNCYLVWGAVGVEDAMYSYRIYQSKDCLDCFSITECESCYWCLDSDKCFSSQFCTSCVNCLECLFCFDCRGCQNCIFSEGLRNKSYHIFNKPVSKEDYAKFLADLKTGSFMALQKNWKRFRDFSKDIPKRFAIQQNCESVTGDKIARGKNGVSVFDCKEFENLSYAMLYHHSKDSMDVSYFGFKCERVYEAATTGSDVRNLAFVYDCWDTVFDSQYSDSCISSHDLFGCTGLRQKSYCILNKQYTKEDYENLRSRVIEHMKKSGEYGEFFPVALSPFCYNETAAQEYVPLAKEEVVSRGWKWRDVLPGISGKETAKTDDLPDDIADLKIEDWAGKILLCRDCGKNYQLVKKELMFYQKYKLPVPRSCVHCRHTERARSRTPIHLWRRSCQCNKSGHPSHQSGKCPNEFETPYAPERPETVYCEACYQAELG